MIKLILKHKIIIAVIAAIVLITCLTLFQYPINKNCMIYTKDDEFKGYIRYSTFDNVVINVYVYDPFATQKNYEKTYVIKKSSITSIVFKNITYMIK